MMYFQGFVVPVRIENKQAYLDMAKKAAPIFAEYGALRTVECWGDDVMDGKITDSGKPSGRKMMRRSCFPGSGGLTRRRATRQRRSSWPTIE
jgi:hypothetical protein